MQASPSCSRDAAVVFALLVTGLLSIGGCVTVRADAKELLADPAMSFDGAAMARRQEQHALENREASFGGGNAQGSGCGCN